MRTQEEYKQQIFFLAGFFIGVLYIYFLGTSEVEGTDFLSIQNLIQVKYMELVYKDYFLYLLKKRIGIIFVLVAVSFALPGKYILQGFLMMFGCSMGSLLSVMVMRYGGGGVVLFWGLVLPQDIAYVPAAFGWVRMLEGWNEGLFFRRNSLGRKREKRSGVWIKVLLLLGVTIIGILLECYVNPKVLNFCFKNFL